MRGVAQAALEETIALVTLDEPPPEGEFVLELHAPGTRPVVVLASSAADPSDPLDPMHPVRVRPFDDEHYGQLLAFVCMTEGREQQPVTRWSTGYDRAPSLLRVDTVQDELSDSERMPGRPSLADVDPLLGRMLASDKYKIESVIGEGSAGAVYRGRHVALDMPLAIKVLHPRFRADKTFARRFFAEARAASKLDHPNVTRVQDFGEEPDGLLYIVMELLRGMDLRQLMHTDDVSRTRRIEILLSVLNALAAADDQGIVHRDIKPENIMVVESRDDDGKLVDLVKVCDFGLATVKPRVAGGTDIRQAAAAMSWVAGTPQYMSPEQILGEDLDVRADLYACGVILFELLTDRLPFHHSSVMHLMRMQLYEPPPRMRTLDPTIDAGLEALTMRALSKRPEDRFQSPREFRSALRDATRTSRNKTTHGWLPAEAEAKARAQVVTARPSPPAPQPAPPSAPQPAPQPAPKTLPAMARAREQSATPEQIADRILSDVPSVLNALTGESTAQQFVSRLRAIVSAFPVLIDRGAIGPLADIAATLSAMAKEQSTPEDPRPDLSMRALEPLRHETHLVKIAQAFLAGSDSARQDARFLLSIGGQSGLQAALDARRKLARRAINRKEFVSLVRSYGAESSLLVLPALALAMDDAGGDPPLLEDLLRALPDQRIPTFRSLASRLAHHGDPTVRRAIAERLPALLGPDSHSILRSASRDPDDLVRVAAIVSLRQIGGIDDAIVALARDVLNAQVETSPDLRVAVAEALSDVAPEMRREAAAVLADALMPRSRSFMNVLLKVSSVVDDTRVTLAIACSILAVGGLEGRRTVERRLAASKPPLRDELERLLR
jgi:serine/threonine-protein kinase